MGVDSFSNEVNKQQFDRNIEESLFDKRIDINAQPSIPDSFDFDKRVEQISHNDVKNGSSFDPDERIEVSAEDEFGKHVEIKDSDIHRAERLHNAFGLIDALFASDRIVYPSDAEDVSIESLDDIITDMTFEEATASVIYFIANKIGISEYVTDTNLVGFKASNQRQEYVNEVKEYTKGNNALADGWRAFSEGIEETAQSVEERIDSIGEAVSDTVEEIGDAAGELKNDIESGLESFAGFVVDTAKTVGYFVARSFVGVFRTLEDTHDYLAGSIVSIVDKERAYEIVQSCISDSFTEKLNVIFEPSEIEQRIGGFIDNASESSVDVALSILFFAGGPVGAAVALAAMFFENSGEKLRDVTTESGKMGGKEFISATVSGLAQVAVMALMKSASNAILSKGVKPMAEGVKTALTSLKGLTGKELVSYLGGRLTGTLSMTVLGGVNAAFVRIGSMVEKYSDVVLGFEDNFDVIKEFKDTMVSVAGGALIGGLFYFGLDSIKASSVFQKVFKSEYSPDYFHNMFDQVVMRDKYIEAMKAYAEKEGLDINFDSIDWDSMKLVPKDVKDATREAFSDSTKAQLKAEWEKITGKDWPTYSKDIYDPKTGTLLRKAGQPFDMHHMLPVCFGGTNTVENMLPVDVLSHRELHSFDQSFREMTRLFTEALGLSSTGFSAALAGLTRLFLGGD